jgi:hypothetical protein
LPTRPGADGAVSRMGLLFGLANGLADFYRDRRARNGHRVREPGGGGAAAADRSAGIAAARNSPPAARLKSPRSSDPRLAVWPMRSRPACPTA